MGIFLNDPIAFTCQSKKSAKKRKKNLWENNVQWHKCKFFFLIKTAIISDKHSIIHVFYVNERYVFYT